MVQTFRRSVASWRVESALGPSLSIIILIATLVEMAPFIGMYLVISADNKLSIYIYCNFVLVSKCLGCEAPFGKWMYSGVS